MEAIQRDSLAYYKFKVEEIIKTDIIQFKDTYIYEILEYRLKYAKIFNDLENEDDIKLCKYHIDFSNEYLKLYLSI